jgi:hypothetical protein
MACYGDSFTFYLCIDVPSALFRSDFPTEIMRATHRVHLILLHLIILIIKLSTGKFLPFTCTVRRFREPHRTGFKTDKLDGDGGGHIWLMGRYQTPPHPSCCQCGSNLLVRTHKVGNHRTVKL